MTMPHIGNYGVTGSDDQAAAPAGEGWWRARCRRRHASWRAEGWLAGWLDEHGWWPWPMWTPAGSPGTSAAKGPCRWPSGAVSDEAELRRRSPRAPRRMTGQELATTVSTANRLPRGGKGARIGRVVAVDLGMKRAILDQLSEPGSGVEVVPATASASPTSWPCVPTAYSSPTARATPSRLLVRSPTVEGLLGKVPVFGICLGHQVLGLAHRGADLQAPLRSPRRQPPGSAARRTAGSRSPRRTTGSPSTSGRWPAGRPPRAIGAPHRRSAADRW